MFRKHSINVSLAKTPATAKTATAVAEETAVKLIDKISKKQVAQAAAAALAVYASVVAINTSARIAEDRFSLQ